MRENGGTARPHVFSFGRPTSGTSCPRPDPWIHPGERSAVRNLRFLLSAFRISNFDFRHLPDIFWPMNSDMHVAGQLTALGWTMFGLYLVAAAFAFRAAAICRAHDAAALGHVWNWLGAILATLGLNKPFDLQTRLLTLGHLVAQREHLLAYRIELYALFFLGFAAALIALLGSIWFRWPGQIRRLIRQLPWAAAGCALVSAYVVIRVVNIDHVDEMLGYDWEEIPFLWLLEAGGVLLILAQALNQPKAAA